MESIANFDETRFSQNEQRHHIDASEVSVAQRRERKREIYVLVSRSFVYLNKFSCYPGLV